MGKITVLDQDTINRISAGEVIERPSSVVKELVENAIDAGATAITVEIKEGGLSFVRITDNGSGIEKDDIRTAFYPHATSKIKNANDLDAIASLGFRGEALASIAAVCRVELITKTKDSILGTSYVIEGGQEISTGEIGAADGTTFVVKDIFFNTPARRKFLKSAQTEGIYIGELVERIALSRPDISFRFISNSQTKLFTPGNGKQKDVIYSVFGREIQKNTVPVKHVLPSLSITGYAGKPVINRANRAFEIFFINGRYVKCTLVYKAIEEAYRPYMMQHKHPFCVLNIDIPADLIDVNVHPSKLELRFRQEENLFREIVTAVSSAVKGGELIVDATGGKSTPESFKEQERSSSPAYSEPFEKKRTPVNPYLKGSSSSYVADRRLTYDDAPVKDTVPVSTPSSIPVAPASLDNSGYDVKLPVFQPIKPPASEDPAKEVEAMISVDKPSENDTTVSSFMPQPIEPPSDDAEPAKNRFLTGSARAKHRVLGQVFKTYWVVEYDHKMYMIDQHAAHEKIIYEKLMKSFSEKNASSQLLMPSIMLQLTERQRAILNENMSVFTGLGYEIEDLGALGVSIQAVPADLLSINKTELLIEMIDDLGEGGRVAVNRSLNAKIATMACKAAVKGNTVISQREAEEIIDKLLELDNPYACPHGRPTIISFSEYEINRKFKRIV